MTFRRNSFITKVKDWLRYFENRSFSKQLKDERNKKYLYQNRSSEDTSWIHFYKKARRWAYFRSIYSVYTKNQLNFRLAFWTIGIALISGSLYIFFASPYFQIAPSRVIIERTDTYSDINIAYKAMESIYGSPLWFVDNEEIRENIRTLEKNLEKIQITKLPPNSLKIIITSSPPKYSVDFPWIGKSYLLSQNGILIPNRNKESDLPRLQIYSSELLESSFLDYKEAISPGAMSKMQDVSRAFSVDFSTYVVTSQIYYRTENELHLLLENGTRLMFSLDNSLEKQLLSLKFALEQTPGLLSSPETIYIDSRIVGKIFVCKTADVCRKNLVRIYGNPPY